MMAKSKPTQGRKQHILQAAVQLFMAKGIQQTSMNEIILVSGLSKGGVYHYFDSKESLVLGVVDIYTDIQRKAINQALAQDGSVRDRLQNMVRVVALQDPIQHSRMSLDMLTMALDNPHFLERVRYAYDELMGLLSQLIRSGIDRGEFRADTDPLQVAMAIAAVFDGLRFQQPLVTKPTDWVAIGTTACQQILDGISVPAM